MSQSERRAHPRSPAAITVRFRNDGTTATTHDVSRGGCAVLAPRVRLVNEKIPVTLVHPATGQTLDVVIEVKRAAGLPDGKFLLGVQFVDADVALQGKIAAFVDSLGVAAAPSPAPGDETARLVTAAFDAEMSGKVKEAIALLDQAIAASPLPEVFATRARLAEQTGDLRGAVQFAARAADADRNNPQFAQLYQRLTSLAGTAPASASIPPPQPRPQPRSFMPRSRLAWIGTVVAGGGAMALFGGNLWYWLLRTPPGGPNRIDPRPFAELVPMSALALRDGRAYGTVTAEWSALEGKDKRLVDLAARLSSEGARSVFLSDAESRLVASYRDGTPRLFPPR